ncbi:aldehyde dehydrogenase [Salsipaludibacter albus]|uniref:aldehyde dehydrogenase n=1 Tax=Salsipaludibacter albus TaxID=2849650 RepID=UPI001EE3C124|nr:aldehyde dehydrogenase [Salsipaludibacter albus]MBY5162982.1 aldehyde dehydrogenase [Salsipaludibacter albus]
MTTGTWHRAAADLSAPTRLFVDGDWRDPDGTEDPLEQVNPATGVTWATVAAAGPADVDRAVAAARRAFDDGRWSRTSPSHRRDVMLAWADLVEAHADDLALLVTTEMGKPIGDTRGIEVPALLKTIRWYAELADKLVDELPVTGPDELALVTREPVGVVGAIVPWNFPLTMAGWKLGPALATGNSVVLKPAEYTSTSMLEVARLATEAGLPDGVLNVLPGRGPVAGDALARHDDVDTLTFTGSGATGRSLLHAAADSNLKPVWLELGGKSPNVVFADAPNLDVAADMAAWGVFFNSGEMCTAPSRLLVQREVLDEVTAKVVARARSRVVGDPLDEATETGPIVSARQLDTIREYVAIGRDEADLLVGGEAPDTAGPEGFWLAPTVFGGVDNDHRIAREEIFGPVLSIIAFDDEEEAVRLANDTPYGLAAGVWTSDLSRAHRVSRAITAGTVWVNCYEEGGLSVPFGGRKQSGNGRDKSVHAIDKFTALKTTWIAL